MNPQGIFVIKGKENAVAQIEHLCKKYNLKNAANNVQSIAIFKAIVEKRSVCSKMFCYRNARGRSL